MKAPAERADRAAEGEAAPTERRKRGDGASVEAVMDVLRARISRHDLQPGQRIQEIQVAEEFGVSRSRVRDVLAMLEQRGLIERIPNRGAVVARLEAKEVYDIFDIREVLEGLAVRLATRNAPKGLWDDLIETLGPAMAEKIAAGDIESYLEALDALRDRTLQWADSAHTSNFLNLVLDKARVIARRVTLLPGRAEEGRALHHRMLLHMAAGEAAEAERCKREIVQSARACLERYQSLVF